MEANIRCLTAACERSGIPFQFIDPECNVVRAWMHGRWAYFQHTKTPFNPEVVFGLCRDKTHAYQLLHQTVPMPESLAFLDCNVEERYREYRIHASLEEMLAEIEAKLPYPLVIKRNRGFLGHQVHLCPDRAATQNALTAIFNPQSQHYDYVAVAQRYLPARVEYRLIHAFGEPVLAYQRGTDTGFNVKYWEQPDNGPSVITDPTLLAELHQTVLPVYRQIDLPWVGFDLLRDEADQLWLLELNSAPRFDHLAAAQGDECVIAMFQRVLAKVPAAAWTSNFSQVSPRGN